MSERQGRYAVKVDANQGGIVKALTEAGYMVFDTHALGKGFPDLLVQAWYGTLVLLEVKTEEGSLTEDEQKFFNRFKRAPVYMVRTAKEALQVMRMVTEREG